MPNIAVVDYGMSNLHSVKQALSVNAPADTKVYLVESEADIHDADKVVVPGQGAAAQCMEAITQRNLKDALIQAAHEKPFLGICMGLQLLLTHSLENEGVQCLGMFAGESHHLAEHIRIEPGHKIPHMGWNKVFQQMSHPLWHGIEDGAYFYFAHSYYAQPADPALVAGVSEYGEHFPCAIASGYVFAIQFHPEKSSSAGLQLLKNFVAWNGETC